jgi:hypothetical protein
MPHDDYQHRPALTGDTAPDYVCTVGGGPDTMTVTLGKV